MEKWKINKNIVKIDTRFVDVLTSGSDISLLNNDIGYITASTFSGSIYNTGSFTGSFTGDFFGTLYGTASYALTASYVEGLTLPTKITNGLVSASVYQSGDIFIINSGSKEFVKIDTQGKTTIFGEDEDVFLINNQTQNSLLSISQSGVMVLSTQSIEPIGNAPFGGIVFTSRSLYIGLE
jgi:hypothetical protein